MLTKRENYIEAVMGRAPEYVPSYMDDAAVISMDFWKRRDADGVDFLGVKWVGNDAGTMPDHSPASIALKDLAQWRDHVIFPDLSKMDWEKNAEEVQKRYYGDYARICQLNTHGLFLIPVNLMGWENALCAIYEEPEELEALISHICDYMCELARCQIERYDPDIVCTGDDIANSRGMFFNLETWEKIYRPYFKKVIDVIHDSGKLVEFHCCGDCIAVAEDLLSMGVDIFQLTPPSPELRAFRERHGNEFALTGGWDRHGPGNAPGASEETVRQSVRDAIDVYGKDGRLVFWDGGVAGSSADSKNKRAWIADELRAYGRYSR